MTTQIRQLMQDESGATAIEYALIAALVAIALIAVLGSLGDSLETAFGNIGQHLDAVPAPEGGE